MPYSKEMDINSLKEYSIFLVELLLSVYPDSAKKDISIFRKSYKDVIETLHLRATKAGFKTVINDLEMQIKLLDPRLIVAANVEIEKNFGFIISQNKEAKKADKIIDRGVIKNEDEYRFLSDYFEIISGDSLIDKVYLKKIGQMLDKYQIG